MSHENAGRVVGTTRPGVGLAGVALGWARTYSGPMARSRVRASSSVLRVGRCVVLLAPACFCVLASGATAAPPPNDDLGQATPIRLGSTVRGTVTDATKQRDEARHGRLATAGSVWFRLRAKRRVGVELRTCGADFDSILAVYGGRSLRSLSVVRFNNDGCGRSRGGSGRRSPPGPHGSTGSPLRALLRAGDSVSRPPRSRHRGTTISWTPCRSGSLRQSPRRVGKPRASPASLETTRGPIPFGSVSASRARARFGSTLVMGAVLCSPCTPVPD